MNQRIVIADAAAGEKTMNKASRNVARSLEYRVLFVLVFATFLVASTVMYLLRLPMAGRSAVPLESPYRAARAATSASLPFVF